MLNHKNPHRPTTIYYVYLCYNFKLIWIMKHFLWLITAIFLNAASALPQSAPNTSPHFQEQNNYTGKSHYVTDSTWYLLGNTFGQNWFKNRIYRVQERNNAGNVLKASDYEYDTLGLYWFRQRQYEGQFISDTIRRLWLSYIYDQSNTVWRLADSIHFNIHGSPTISWYKIWDPVAHKFTGGKLSEFFYDEQGKLHLTFNHYYDTISANWKKNNHEIVYYNQHDLDSVRQYFSWNSAANEWTDSLRISFTYDNKLNPATQLNEINVGNTWINSKKWDYNFNNGLLQEEYEYDWDEFAEDWEFKEFSEHEYNEYLLPETITDYLWDGFEWLNKTRKTYTYNPQQQITEILNEYWSFGFSQWASSSLSTYEYGSNGNRKFFTFLIWDEENDRWRNFYKEENFWSLFEPQSIGKINQTTFRVFPNPAGDKVEIILDRKIQGSKINHLHIYDNDGRLISSNVFSGDKTWVNVSAFSSGIYLFLISTNAGTGSEIVIKK
jgi:hypothetical protein